MIYFQTHNHITDSGPTKFDKNDISKEKLLDFTLAEDCIICLEKSNEKLSVLVKDDNFDFEKTCECDCYVHETCLDEWLEKRDMCPICRDKWPLLLAHNIDVGNRASLFFAFDDERRTTIYMFCSRNVSRLFCAIYVFFILDFIYNLTIYIVLFLGHYK